MVETYKFESAPFEILFEKEPDLGSFAEYVSQEIDRYEIEVNEDSITVEDPKNGTSVDAEFEKQETDLGIWRISAAYEGEPVTAYNFRQKVNDLNPEV